MRSPALVFLLIGLFFVHSTRAQSNALIIQGQTGKLYLLHTVAAKETWYSIGRLYNIGPKGVAAFNTLSMDKPLSIGQEIEIPLTAANFSQADQKAAGEIQLPVYHLVQEKEWMYRISVNHNKVPIGSLEKWNHITKDQVKPGMYLVVGFLKVKTALSAFAKEPPPAPVTSSGIATTTSDNNPAATRAFSAPGSSSSTGTPSSPGGKSDTSPMMINKPMAAKKTVAPVGQITKMEVSTKEGSKPPSGAKDGEPAAKDAKKTEAVVKEETNPESNGVHEATKTFNGGYFRTDFTEGGKTTNGMAGTFKSSSGWQDGKYYALMNNVAVGTIVRVSLPASNKAVFAKILGQLPDMKESVGLTIRISNAAASELGLQEGKFNVEVKY